MSLPQSLLKQLWDAGYGGKVIRVPAKNERLQLKVIANEILKDAEDIYESKGTTFVLERRGRSDFYRSFGALKCPVPGFRNTKTRLISETLWRAIV